MILPAECSATQARRLMYEPNLTLSDHEGRSAERASEIKGAIKEVGHAVEKLNIFKSKDGGSMDAIIPALLAGGNQGGVGTGLGAGVLGGVLGGALLGGNGLVNRNNGLVNEGFVTPAQLTAALAGVTDTLQSTTILQTLGDIKAAVPLAEGQVQLALAGAQADINGNINSSLQIAVQGQANINKNISESIATALAGQSAIKESIAAYGVANLTATKDAQYALSVAITNDGEKTRALIASNEMANLQRMLTVSESRALEDRLTARTREVEVNVTNTNTNTATAIQAQNQAQAQSQAIIQLAAELRNLSGDIQAVRQSQVTFNSGTMTGSGTQSAANTKVG
ncbi:gp38 putative tail-fiber protein [Iodobacter phage PhiPLPE]|uniref:Gp38 putative tail-fiber protein n=1 Tax=Iodobacter phage PhiPLPE TaxID=551895 RepID=B5AX57_9CAUD|nr:gp38 putative tail-fiber protein [Iodobacter phage PhiPLPE]ACG60360.1 gp38 putative tail-fiber protein [Iodobacter phage PhiPLPE]